MNTLVKSEEITVIVNELLNKSRTGRLNCVVDPETSTGLQLLESNTVGIQLHRQTGKSFWVISRLIEDPNAVAFMLRDNDLMFNIRNYEMVFGNDLPESVTNRIYSLLQVSCDIPDKNKKLIKQSFDTVYIDDADQYLTLLGDEKLFDLISNYNPSAEVVLVSNIVPETIVYKTNKWWLNEFME